MSYVEHKYATDGWTVKDNQKYIDYWFNQKPQDEKFDPYICSSFPPSHSQWLENGDFKIFSTHHPTIRYEVFGPDGSARLNTIKECKEYAKNEKSKIC
jgi:hypothetical protein